MTDDTTLVARAKAGDFEAFEQLVNRHERRVYALAMNIVRQHEDAQDIVQTAFLSAMEHLSDFREEASFATWISRIATNAALKVRRKQQGLDTLSLDAAMSENETGDIPHPEYIADWRDDPAKIVEGQELKEILDAAIDTLDEKYRLVFVLRDVAGLSVEETASELGISRANVKVRLLRARLALREKLTHVFGDETKRMFRAHRHEGDEHGVTPAEAVLRSYHSE